MNNRNNTTKQTILITGATGNIGGGTAIAMAKRGASLVLPAVVPTSWKRMWIVSWLLFLVRTDKRQIDNLSVKIYHIIKYFKYRTIHFETGISCGIVSRSIGARK